MKDVVRKYLDTNPVDKVGYFAVLVRDSTPIVSPFVTVFDVEQNAFVRSTFAPSVFRSTSELLSAIVASGFSKHPKDSVLVFKSYFSGDVVTRKFNADVTLGDPVVLGVRSEGVMWYLNRCRKNWERDLNASCVGTPFESLRVPLGSSRVPGGDMDRVRILPVRIEKQYEYVEVVNLPGEKKDE